MERFKFTCLDSLPFFCVCAVPPPGVEVSVNSGQFHTDSIVMLFCTVSLPMTGSSQVALSVTWYGPNGQLRNSSNVTLTGPYLITDQVLQSNVTISNYVRSINNGEYTCNATIVPQSPYIIGKSAASRKTISISG